MFNADYRIYTVDVVIDPILGTLVDPELNILISEEDRLTTFHIKYPYFKKPEYKLLDLLDTEDRDAEEELGNDG